MAVKFPIPETALQQHIADLGKTGSGKTSTAKLIIEHLVAEGSRVCILDSVKSDWWGLTSSADGKKPGLPFHILGGPRGHVPLHASSGKAIAEIVANGTLPLSILDMANFEPGGLQRFFVDFAPTLLRKMRGVLYLVLEEAHEFAPKERSGIGQETMMIHWAKKLATAGRSKGIRLIVLTQRTQALHNAILGSCETMIAHRLTAPADQKPVADWLKANAPKDTAAEIAASLASLRTGTAWVCSGEAGMFERVQFPRIGTYDNSATPTDDLDAREVRTAAVDVEKLRAIVGDAAKEAEANDPKLLKAALAKAEAELAKMRKAADSASSPGEKINMADQRAHERALTAAREEGAQAVREAVPAMLDAQHQASFEAGFQFLASRRAVFEPAMVQPRRAIAAIGAAITAKRNPAPHSSLSKTPISPSKAAAAAASPRPAGGLPTPQRRVLASIGFWRSVGTDAPSRAQVGGVAGYSPSSGGFNNILGSLNTAGLITIPRPGTVALADGTPYDELTPDQAREQVYRVISNPQRKLVDAVLAAGVAMSRDDLGMATEYSPSSGGFNNLIGSLCALTIFDKPAPGMVDLSIWAKEALS